MTIILYTFTSVIAISLVSLVSIYAFAIQDKILKKFILFMVSFSTGALLADTLFHLLPQIADGQGFGMRVSTYISIGFLFSFIIEKFIHWRHCHKPEHIQSHTHSFAYMNLFGDAVHNFIDGLIIAASYLVSIPVGIATTIAVLIHEIPQEIGDFGILIHGGLSKTRALFLNFLTALTAIIGAALALIIGQYSSTLINFLIPFAVGSFLYIAGSDLIPELHKETRIKHSIGQLATLLLGIIIIASFVFFE